MKVHYDEEGRFTLIDDDPRSKFQRKKDDIRELLEFLFVGDGQFFGVFGSFIILVVILMFLFGTPK